MTNRKAGRTRALDQGEYEALAQFRYSLRRFLSFSEAAAGVVGLTPQQYQALLAIKGASGEGPVTINDLARQLMIRHNSAVGLVDRLEEEGLIVRRVARDDRRKVNLILTPRGSRMFQKLAGAHRAELARIGPTLSGFLDRVAASGEARGPRQGP
ncbi:MAG: winged helix-turn-helix transcriptional regulator [Betaproteobacteria bacterium]|nr:MarR family winged helix-turn-helix transcriptional regulator [Betaproteobacteria bacterium]MDE2004196.1 winged helix-turn-helix transcriptional regulator [Betaproteobacteria bacterium]MDE2209174.1 winged helix-turn-helix transcriptional regulator [Betaproteobacteria bacterium]MDE2360379.1 winged helix-turn-helix transcriptional regulator [Betaproteobacteria bacterium]